MNWTRWASVAVAFLLLVVGASAQETTGGLEGTVKDPTGALVAKAHIVLSGTGLVGAKETDTDASGHYNFANLPPGTYEATVTATGFSTLKQGNIFIDVGHLPTLDFSLQLGSISSTVEVTSAAPMIDVSTTHNITDLNQQDLQNLPHGYSFQSVLQFAPQVRNEPLEGGAVGPNASANTANATSTGGQSPAGTATNGGAFGFSAAGGADSENSYLVDGQETADAIGGFSHTNVPFSFIESVQVKQSGIEAEYGGAMGAVMNVVTERGSNRYHGSLLSQFERSSWDGSPNAFPRYDPGFTAPAGSPAFLPDATLQYYQPKKDNLSDNFPGFTFGGPLIPSLRDKLWFFVGFNPEFRAIHRTVDWAFPGNSAFPATTGPTTFTSNIGTYYTTARIDAVVTQKIRVFGDWLYQYQRDQGEFLPEPDSVTGLLNSSATSPAALFAHNLGNAAPNVTTNLGADITLTPQLIATFRWGYNFQNYHDSGMPTGGAVYSFLTSGAGATDNLGNSIPATSQLSQVSGFASAPDNINNTHFNATHRNQINADMEWFHSGWHGTHDFKFGYGLSRLSNSIDQYFNEPDVQVLAGGGNYYSPEGAVGVSNCAAVDPGIDTNPNDKTYLQGGIYGGCAGQYGYIYLYDTGSFGQATSMNHAFFVQDGWQIAPGLTINAGIRLEYEYLPAEDQPLGGISKPIQFGWGNKIAPRVGLSWDPHKDGKWKIFGSYGKYYDTMKLNLAISSFGGQYWQNCYYALNTQDLSSILPVFNNANRYCVGPNSSSQGNFADGTPPGITFLENQNNRTFPTTCATCTSTEEGVAPGLKPYSEHESVFGIDHQLSKSLAFEARWDRRRLDNAIEDAALYNPNVGETFVIVNPGKGVDRTFDGFYNFLYGTSSGCGTTFACPPDLPVASRSYDGVEFRLTDTMTRHITGMASYTYSHLRGNYPGLTSSDLSDGGGGRNAPNNSRAFDEPYFYFDAAGKQINGPLNTDRPNAFKGYGYYDLPWLHRFTTDFGIFQFFYQGSPVSSFVDEGFSESPFDSLYGVPSAQGGAFPSYVVPRGQFQPLTQDPNSGAITVGTPYARRTPWFMQTDFQIMQSYKVSESKTFSFAVSTQNLFNQHSVVAYWESMDTNFYSQYLQPPGPGCGSEGSVAPCSVTDGPAFYSAAMHGYNLQSALNNAHGTGTNGHMTISSIYGKPLYYQVARSLYMTAKFTF